MPTRAVAERTHLAVFVTEPSGDVGTPVAAMPMYAEVGVRVAAPVDPRLRDDDDVVTALRQADLPSADDDAGRARIVAVTVEALSRLLPASAVDALLADRPAKVELLRDALSQARSAAGQPLAALRRDHLAELVNAVMRTAAQRRDLPTVATSAERVECSYPLGVLATDHAGYLSFDLTRLPADVRTSVAEAVEALRADPQARPDVALWLYPAVGAVARFDALQQRRGADEAIVARLELTPTDGPWRLRGLGLPSMQLPSIVDWRLSPGSFASTPSGLIGADGCQAILPANVALQEFHFYQAVGLSDAAAQPLGLGPAAGQVRAGLLHEYRMAWYQLGHSLGQLVYSLPLAPGESVNLAVVDWVRADEAERTEDTKLNESLTHELRRERAVTETVDAAIREYQHGSSSMSGLAASAGGSGGIGVAGAAVGISGAIGAASSNSSGSRDLSANTVQRLSDNVTQASAAMRELRSTVVVRTSQAERETIETRTVVNYNHSHTLTVLYYEVLRHFRVATELTRRSPAILVRVRADWFAGADVDAARIVLTHRPAIRAALLDQRYAPGLDAVERWLARGAPLPPIAAPSALAIHLRYFTFEMTVGGIALEDRTDGDVNIQAELFGPPSPIRLVNQAGGPSNILDPPGAFGQKDACEKFVAMPTGVPFANWADVDGIAISIDVQRTFISFKHIKITAWDTPGRREHVILDQGYENGHLVISDSTTIVLPLLPPPGSPPPPGHPPEALQDQAQVLDLLAHLRRHSDHYARAITVLQDPAGRAAQLATVKLGDGTTVADHVENRVLEFVGEFAAYPCTDAAWSSRIEATFDPQPSADAFDERLVTLPTRGVFADARLGACNASELIDNTRFWDWQQSPIPHMAPEIAPVTPVTPTPQQQAGMTPTAFPSSLVNIVNPPAAPEPTGLGAALNVLATPNIFRDMSGRAEVADLLKKLSDNTISIAEAANQARGIQQRYGASAGVGGGGGGGYSGGGGYGSAPGGVGGARAAANQPSAVNRDLQDLQNVLGQATQRGLITPAGAQSAYQSAVSNALDPADLQNVADRFARPATNPNHLIGLAGEQITVQALRQDGLVVFYDWRKHVTGNGIDLVAYDPATKKVWLIDNKAQLRGISAAESLTGPQFAGNRAAVRDFLAHTHADAVRAAEALRALDDGNFVKVVANGWAGKDTRFTTGLIGKGLSIYDLRMRPPGLFGDQATWAAAFKSLPKAARRVSGVRGAVTVEAALFIGIVALGGLWVMRTGEETKRALGELAAETAFGATLCLLPGGYFANMVLNLESDENPATRLARKREETINEILAAVPGIDAMTKAEQDACRLAVATLVDEPLAVDVPAPTTPAKPPALLPGLDSPVPRTDWT